MKCDNCGQEEATIHLTRVVENKMSSYHLCERCAAEQGLEEGVGGSPSAPLTDFLAQMGKAEHLEQTATEVACEGCGLTLTQFKKSGRLGCADCYRTFDQHLRSLFRRLHAGTQHVGKVYMPPDPSEADRTARIASLRRSLQRAVDAEDFERAASIRDQIREMEDST